MTINPHTPPPATPPTPCPPASDFNGPVVNTTITEEEQDELMNWHAGYVPEAGLDNT